MEYTYEEFINDVLCVVVLYKKKLAESETFMSLNTSLSNTKLSALIYDNSPSALDYDRQENAGWNITYIHDDSNPGVSKAYNKGYEIAKQSGKKWLILLDQDTTFVQDSLRKYYDSVKSHPSISLHCPIMKTNGQIISPCAFSDGIGTPLASLEYGVHPFGQLSIINSGLCVSVEAFAQTGGYNELLKLDYCDHEFINRYKKKYSSFAVIHQTIAHQLSFSGDDQSVILKRFMLLCGGACSYAKVVKGTNFGLAVYLLKQSLNYTLKFRKPDFLYNYIKYFLLGARYM